MDNSTVHDNLVKTEQSSIPQLEALLNDNVTVLLSAGQFDLMDGPAGLEQQLSKLNTYWGIEDFKRASRQIYYVNPGVSGGLNDVVYPRVGGYYQQANNLHYLVV